MYRATGRGIGPRQRYRATGRGIGPEAKVWGPTQRAAGRGLGPKAGGHRQGYRPQAEVWDHSVGS